jgi:class 3 adenylate cyclase/pimeloyl-ACP methyl ester carboxylesterase
VATSNSGWQDRRVVVDVDYARRGEVSIAYQVVGDGPVDVIFGAGLVSHLDLLWADPRATSFLRGMAGFGRLLLFDKPGTGLSDPVVGAPTVEQRAEDFLAVLDAVGSRRAVVVGFSEAETPAIQLAATRPERVEALVLISGGARLTTAPHFDPEDEDYVENVMWRQFRHSQQHWGDGSFFMALSPFVRGSLVYRRLAPSLERAAASPGMARVMIESMRGYDVTGILGNVRVPTLVVHRTDEWVPVGFSRHTSAAIPDAKYVELSGDEHMVFFNGDDVLDAIGGFIGGRQPAASPGSRRLLTVLFTDIVGSSRLAAELGDDRWCALLAHHDQVVADEVDRHDGRLVKTMGDGALAAFERPAMAIRCASRLRACMSERGIQIRAGIHIGECEVVEPGQDLAGIAVHVGARLASLAAPDQVLVSSTVRDLVVGAGVQFVHHGSHELRNIEGRWEVYAVADDPAPDQQPATSGTPTEAALTPAPTETMRPVDRAIVAVARHLPAVSRTALRAASWRSRTSDRAANYASPVGE